MDDLGPLVAGWPVTTAAAAVTDARTTLAVAGDQHWISRVASVGKLVVGLTALVALEEGSIDLDEPAGPEGSTVRHLLSHASGLGFDDHRVLAPPGTRRIYSNTGIEVFAEHLATRTAMPYAEYQRQAVLEPLGMAASELRGSPAHGLHSSVADLATFARELLAPTLVHPTTLAEAITPQYPDLAGVVPGLGSFDPNPWGLTFELRDHKPSHWTGARVSADTFGHFGGAGTFLWVDPRAGLAAAALTDREFDDWALAAWPPFNDAVHERYA